MNVDLNGVHRGMHVVDVSGEDIGRVDLIRMGDPEATTTAGNTEITPRPLDLMAEALGGEDEPDVPEPLRSRLVRTGYLKLDGAHLLEADRYVPADKVRDVSEDKVRLSVRRDDLIKEV
jgi:hypothetical protein